MLRVVCLIGLLSLPTAAGAVETAAPPFEPLWPGKAPGSLGREDADVPAMMVFPPAAAAPRTGSAVVVFPGGGYWTLAMDHEGVQVGRWLSEKGITAVVVRYRHAPRYHHPVPSDDARRAIRLVRHRAARYRLAPDRIGVWGFSAGGHLAATVATRFDGGDPEARDPIDRESSRPDFAILAYPVISFVGAWTHKGSAEALIGRDGHSRLYEELSAERNVTAWTPPTFLFHTAEDKAVPVENSLAFFQALRTVKVPAELHVFETGAHGVGLAPADPVLSAWPGRLADWLGVRGLTTPPEVCRYATPRTPVGRACETGGIPAAKALMRQMVAAAARKGRAFECDGCHGKGGAKDPLPPESQKRFAELARLVGVR